MYSYSAGERSRMLRFLLLGGFEQAVEDFGSVVAEGDAETAPRSPMANFLAEQGTVMLN